MRQYNRDEKSLLEIWDYVPKGLTTYKKGLDLDLYFLSLFTVLSLPDICGAIDSEDGEASGDKYKKWFNEYVSPKYVGNLSGEDCYRFRCSLLHQGTSQHQRSSYSRILFIEPLATTNIFHNCVMIDALNIDVRIFCIDMIQGTKVWLNKVEDTELFEKNSEKFMKRYPNGLAPFIKGIPVIG